MPCRTSRLRVLPKPAAKRKFAISSAILSFSSRRADVDAHQGLGAVNGLDLAEVHHVDRDLPGGQQFLERLVDRGLVVVVVQRNGALGRADGGGRPAGEFGHAGLEAADVAQRRGHQQELGLRQFQQRNLPRPAALRIGVEVELVHDDRAEVRRGAFAQGDVGEDFRGAADDRGVLVHAGIAGDHADVLRPEDLAQGKELFRDQGLDGGGVVAALPAGHGLEMCGDGHEGFAGSRGGRQDHVGAGRQLHDGLVLGGVQLQAPGFPSTPRTACTARPGRCRFRVVIRAAGAGSCSTSFIAFQLSASASGACVVTGPALGSQYPNPGAGPATVPRQVKPFRPTGGQVQWDPAKYVQFGDYRQRPFFDLTGRVQADGPAGGR